MCRRSLRFAPRISHRLLRALVRLDNPRVAIAEINRRVGREAARLGLPRPSYQRVRVLLHQARAIRRRPSTAQVLVEVCSRARPPAALLDHAAGVALPRLGPRAP
jgi:hypothetical protein